MHICKPALAPGPSLDSNFLSLFKYHHPFLVLIFLVSQNFNLAVLQKLCSCPIQGSFAISSFLYFLQWKSCLQLSGPEIWSYLLIFKPTFLIKLMVVFCGIILRGSMSVVFLTNYLSMMVIIKGATYVQCFSIGKLASGD